MRRVPLAGLLVILFASHAAAEPVAYKATVTDTEVKLRSGPSDQFPDTGTLKQGTAVVVEREEPNGWLAVTAPKGSVSWIMFTFVEDPASDRPAPRSGFVNHDGDVTLAAGKSGLAQPLNVRREKVPQGTTVLIIGPPATFDGKKWWPIEPPAGDVRYLPKTAVQFDKPANNNFTVRVNETITPVPPGAPLPVSPAVGPLATVPGPGGVTPATGGVTASKPAVNHPLWAQAEAAERDNRLADAEKAYFELASIMNGQGGDHDIANQCYTRIHTLREKVRNAGAKTTNTATKSPPPSVLQPPAKEDRGVRPGTPQPLPPGGPASGANAKEEREQWSGVGVLRRSVVTPDGSGKPAYALESSPGVLKMYVIAGQGVDLEKYIGKRVDVYGTTVSRSTGLSKPYLIASAVDSAP